MVHSGDFFERAVSIASKEFVRGFIIGQVALLLVLIVLLRFLFFRGGNADPVRRITFPPVAGPGKKRPTERGLEGSSPGAETCEWMNALLRRLVLGPLHERLDADETFLARALSTLLSEALADEDGQGTGIATATGMLGPIEITSFVMGSADPSLDWIRSRGGDTWEVQLHWDQAVCCDVETSLLMCWPPKHPVASLPCSFAFSLPRLQARLQITLGPAGQDRDQPAGTPQLRVAISLLPDDFCLEVEIHSLLGHRSKLKDVPKLTSLLQARLKGVIRSRLLYPHGVALVVPTPLDAIVSHLFPTSMLMERKGRAMSH